MTNKISGGCLCGAVSYELPNHFKALFLCHCTQCRKITSSAHASNLFCSPKNFHWRDGEKHIKKFNHPSRKFATAFCDICGSGLPFMSSSGETLIVPAGSLDGEPLYDRKNHIFCAEQAKWHLDENNVGIFDKFSQ